VNNSIKIANEYKDYSFYVVIAVLGVGYLWVGFETTVIAALSMILNNVLVEE
jgi:hypothetical protein|tara:strand:+ start:750 stop:905 length:156 start_codon:yes stop_codon:yes gene_type:complete